MTSLFEMPVVVLAVLAWLSSPPGSLAEAARREAIRRQIVPRSTASLNNVGQPPETGAPAAAVTLPPRPDEPPPAAAAKVEPPAQLEPPRDEKWWRGRMAAARSTLERDEFLAASVQTRINSLQADVVNRDDPAQQAMLRQQLGKALNELERLQKQIEADRKAIADIQVEARRAAVPPGWIR